jgi:hypothetical protein
MSASENRIQRAEFGWPGGDRPGELVFREPVPPDVRAAILTSIAGKLPSLGRDTTLDALTTPDGAVGRYRLATPSAAYFIRTSVDWGHPALEQSITAWLRDHGLAVNHINLAGLDLHYAGRHLRLDIRELLDARHDDGSLTDLRALSVSLAECHRLLRAFPGAAEVRGHAAVRFTHLAKVRVVIQSALDREDWHAFAGDPAWGRQHAEWLCEMVAHYNPRFDELPGAQPLHGQVHRANVLFRRSNSAPVLVDFEEAVQTFAPIAWDIGYLVQRFCLDDAPEPALLRDRLAAIRAAYGAPAPGLAEMMRHCAWYCMAILVDYHQRGIVNPIDEYDKFVAHEVQARELAPLLGEFFESKE